MFVFQICHKGVLHERNLSRFDVETLRLWHLSEYDSGPAECYLWCTRNGEVPSMSRTSQLDQETLEEIMEVINI